MTHLTPWEQSLRQRLDKHEAAPPPGGWERLRRSLDARMTGPEPAAAPQATHHRHARPAWIATALAAAACAVLVWVLLPTEEDPHPAMTAAVKAPAATASVLAQSVADVAQSGEAARGMKAARREAGAGRQARAVGPVIAHAAASAAPMAAALYAEAADEAPECTADSVSAVAAAAVREVRPQRVAGPADRSLAMIRRHAALGKKRHVTLGMAMSATAAGGGMRSERGGYYALSAPVLGASAGANGQEDAGANTSAPGKPSGEPDWLLVGNAQREVSSRVRHKYPVRLGISLHVPLTPRWGLATGLTYTRLSTDITSGSDMAYYQIAQRLHYIGLPLNVRYTMYDSRLFTAYAGAGGEIEKCVSGTRATTCHDGSASPFAVTDEHDLGRGLWQASLGASLGLQLNILPAVALYLEPGLTWYAPDGSSLPSVRHDRPWQFTLQAGLRFSPWR